VLLKNNRSYIGSIFLLSFLVLWSIKLQAKELSVESTVIKWTGAMPAKTHHGQLGAKRVDASIDDSGQIESLKIVLDMTSIEVKDMEPGKDRDKLTKHLKSEDFFFVREFPEARFEFVKMEGSNMIGDIEIRGVKKAIKVPADIKKSDQGAWVLSGVFSFDRQDFNVNYQNSGWFGVAKDKLIYDDVDVKFNIAFH
jgi:polyisoprenoid-binding protein YceI